MKKQTYFTIMRIVIVFICLLSIIVISIFIIPINYLIKVLFCAENKDSLQVFFSTIAQIVGGFLGLTFAVYGIVLSGFYTLEQKDQRISLITDEMKRFYFTQLILTTIFSIMCIVFCLLSVLFIREIHYSEIIKTFYKDIRNIVFLISLLFAVYSLTFNLTIFYFLLLPKRYQNLPKFLQENKGKNKQVSVLRFAKQYSKIKEIIFEVFQQYDIYSVGTTRIEKVDFFIIIKKLYKEGFTSKQENENLKRIDDSFRNIIFGRSDSISKEIYYLSKEIRDSLKKKIKTTSVLL